MSLELKYSERFDGHYTRSVREINEGNKAAKDIVGASYESMREDWIRSNGLDIATSKEVQIFKEKFGNVYNADQYIVDRKTRELLAVEEDKGHYVDKCFYNRAVFNAMQLFAHCDDNNIAAPYFILSCPTKYPAPKDIIKMFRKPLQNIFAKKFKYFHACDHGRTGRNKYLKCDTSPFIIEDKNVEKEKIFLNKLGEQ